MKGKFAKLFDLKNGDQVVVMKDLDDKKAEEFQMVIHVHLDGVTIKGTFGYKLEEKRDVQFNAFDQDEAERYYQNINEKFGGL